MTFNCPVIKMLILVTAEHFSNFVVTLHIYKSLSKLHAKINHKAFIILKLKSINFKKSIKAQTSKKNFIKMTQTVVFHETNYNNIKS